MSEANSRRVKSLKRKTFAAVKAFFSPSFLHCNPIISSLENNLSLLQRRTARLGQCPTSCLKSHRRNHGGKIISLIRRNPCFFLKNIHVILHSSLSSFDVNNLENSSETFQLPSSTFSVPLISHDKLPKKLNYCAS